MDNLELINLFKTLLPKKFRYKICIKKNHISVNDKKYDIDKINLAIIVNNLGLQFNNQYIEPNLLWLLKKNKQLDRINILKNKSSFQLVKSSKVFELKNYLVFHYYCIKYFNIWLKKSSILNFEKEILKNNFINNYGYTSNCNIEVPFNEVWDIDDKRCRVDLCISLLKGNFIIEFNEFSHETNEYSSSKPESRIKTIAHNHYFSNSKFLGIRYVTDSIILNSNISMKKKFYNIFEDIKDIIIINSLSKNEFCINKINSLFSSNTNIGKFIYQNYLDKTQFLIPFDDAMNAYGINNTSKRKLIKNLIMEEEKLNISTFCDNNLQGISDDDSDDESYYEDNELNNNTRKYFDNNMINFNGITAIARQINLTNGFNINECNNANDFLNDTLYNMIQAYEILYDKVSNNQLYKIYN